MYFISFYSNDIRFNVRHSNRYTTNVVAGLRSRAGMEERVISRCPLDTNAFGREGFGEYIVSVCFIHTYLLRRQSMKDTIISHCSFNCNLLSRI